MFKWGVPHVNLWKFWRSGRDIIHIKNTQHSFCPILTGRAILVQEEATQREQGGFLFSLSTTDGFTWPWMSVAVEVDWGTWLDIDRPHHTGGGNTLFPTSTGKLPVVMVEATEQEQGDFLFSLSTTDGFTWPSVHFGTDQMIRLLRGGRVVSYLKDTHFRTRDEIVLLTCPLASKIALLSIFVFNHLTNYIKVFNLPKSTHTN